MLQPLWTVWWFLTQLKTLLPYSPAFTLLGTYPKELKTYIHTQNCNGMFIAVSFITVKTWKQPKCLLVREQINKLQYIQTMEYYTALKRNEFSNHKKTQRKINCILLSEKSQSEKAAYCRSPMTFQKRQNYRDSKKVSGCQR